MTVPLLIAMPGNEGLTASLAGKLGFEVAHVETRKFPDGETYLRLMATPEGRAVAVVCTLDRPNDKLLSLLFAAATARELKASSVGLVSPYLAYMRQDRRFKAGEAVTSREVARLLSGAVDGLVTVDPHLHRYSSLDSRGGLPAYISMEGFVAMRASWNLRSRNPHQQRAHRGSSGGLNAMILTGGALVGASDVPAIAETMKALDPNSNRRIELSCAFGEDLPRLARNATNRRAPALVSGCSGSQLGFLLMSV